MAIGGWTIFCSLQGAASVDCGCLVRFVSQYEKSGWLFSPTFLGGLLPLLGVPSFGQMGVLADLVASGLCPSGEAMAGGHLQRPERLAVLRYADAIDMLLLVPIKNYVSSGRGSASSCRRLLRSPVTSMTRQFLQRSGCNFCFFQRYLVRSGM